MNEPDNNPEKDMKLSDAALLGGVLGGAGGFFVGDLKRGLMPSIIPWENAAFTTKITLGSALFGAAAFAALVKFIKPYPSKQNNKDSNGVDLSWKQRVSDSQTSLSADSTISK